jgi:hypothetical protein
MKNKFFGMRASTLEKINVFKIISKWVAWDIRWRNFTALITKLQNIGYYKNCSSLYMDLKILQK